MTERDGHAPGAPLVALVGPTASGKTAVALSVARHAVEAGLPPIELLSVDSMAVYRGMDIGTAKPTREQRSAVPVHLVDLVDPEEEFTVTMFQAAANEALTEIAARDHRSLLVGGTGLYLRAVIDDLRFPGRYPAVASALMAELDQAGPPGSDARGVACRLLHERLSGIDATGAARIESGNERRLVRALEVTIGSGSPFSSFGPGLERYPSHGVRMIGLGNPNAATASPLDGSDAAIVRRFHAMLEAGFLDEVRALAARPAGLSRTARQALGYRELLGHVEDGVPLEDAIAEAVRRTRMFAKRQRAWFRRDPRIRWVEDHEDPVEVLTAAIAHQ